MGYRDVLLADRPKYLWPLDEQNGTVARDIAGSQHGTYSALYTQGQSAPLREPSRSTFITGESVGAGLVTFPNAVIATLLGDCTVELLAYPTTTWTGGWMLWSCASVGGNAFPMVTITSSPGILWRAGDGTLAGEVDIHTGSFAPTTNRWNHIVFTVSGNVYTHYINARIAGGPTTVAITKLATANTVRLGIRQDAGAGVRGSSGNYGWFAIYNKPLSHAQIRSHYNALQVTPPSRLHNRR
jgi:hypothetical protein